MGRAKYRNKNYYKSSHASQPVYRGSGMTEQHINKVLALLGEDGIKQAVANYHYIVDDTMETDRDKVASLICAMPNTGSYMLSPELYVFQLLNGGMFRIPVDYPYTIRHFVNDAVENYPEMAKTLADFMRPHKHCPQKYKTTNMLVTVVLQTLGDHYDFDSKTTLEVLEAAYDFLCNDMPEVWSSEFAALLKTQREANKESSPLKNIIC